MDVLKEEYGPELSFVEDDGDIPWQFLEVDFSGGWGEGSFLNSSTLQS
jgi:hypothetical protein